MLIKDNFFKNYFLNSSSYKKNLKKTKFFFNSFITELKNNEIPLLESYNKNYEFNFSKRMVKKFSKYKNVIVIGMGGSILGTKSIYSFFIKFTMSFDGHISSCEARTSCRYYYIKIFF